MIICISSLDAHSVYAHNKHTIYVYWANIAKVMPNI